MTLVFLNHETVFHCHVKRRSEWVSNIRRLPLSFFLSCLYAVFQLYVAALFASVYGYDAVFSVYFIPSHTYEFEFDCLYLRWAKESKYEYIWSEYTNLSDAIVWKCFLNTHVRLGLAGVYMYSFKYQLWLMRRWKKWKMRGLGRDWGGRCKSVY